MIDQRKDSLEDSILSNEGSSSKSYKVKKLEIKKKALKGRPMFTMYSGGIGSAGGGAVTPVPTSAATVGEQ